MCQAVQHQVFLYPHAAFQPGGKNLCIPAGKYHLALRVEPQIALDFKLYAEYIACRKGGVQVITYGGYRIYIPLARTV